LHGWNKIHIVLCGIGGAASAIKRRIEECASGSGWVTMILH
jgi:hypothetical protein